MTQQTPPLSSATLARGHQTGSTSTFEPLIQPLGPADQPAPPTISLERKGHSRAVRNHHRHYSVGAPLNSYRPGAQYTSKTSPCSRFEQVGPEGETDEAGRKGRPATLAPASSKQDLRSASVPPKFDKSRFQPTVEDDEDDENMAPTKITAKAVKTAPKEPSPLKQSTTPPQPSPELAPVQLAEPTVLDFPIGSTEPARAEPTPAAHAPPAVNMLDFLTPESGPPTAASSAHGSAPGSAPGSAAPSPRSSPSPVPSLINSDGSAPLYDDRSMMSIPPQPSGYQYSSGVLSPNVQSPGVSPNVIPAAAAMSRTPSGSDSALVTRPPYGNYGPPGPGYLSPSQIPGAPAKPPEWNAITRIRAGNGGRPVPPMAPPPGWQGNAPGPMGMQPMNGGSMGMPQMNGGGAPGMSPMNSGPGGVVSPQMVAYSPVPSGFYPPHAPAGPGFGPPANGMGPQFGGGFMPGPTMSMPMPFAFGSIPPSRPQFALEGPTSPSSQTVAGYELVASRMAEYQSESAKAECESESGPNEGHDGTDKEKEKGVPPLYRRFGSLNHRSLLQLQDELSEMEEQLRNLDEQCAIFQTRPGSRPGSSSASTDGRDSMPASRRTDSRSTMDLIQQRTALIKAVHFKLHQYSSALETYHRCHHTFDSSVPDEVSRYQAFLDNDSPLSRVESRFLSKDDDLMMLGRSLAVSAKAAAAGAATGLPPVDPAISFTIPILGQRSSDLPSLLLLMVAVLAGLCLMLGLGVFALVAIVVSSYSSAVPLFFVAVSIFSAFGVGKVLTTVTALDRRGQLGVGENGGLSFGRRLISTIWNTALLVTKRASIDESTAPWTTDNVDGDAEEIEADFGECSTPLASAIQPSASSTSTVVAAPAAPMMASSARPPHQSFPPVNPMVGQTTFQARPQYMGVPVMRPIYPPQPGSQPGMNMMGGNMHGRVGSMGHQGPPPGSFPAMGPSGYVPSNAFMSGPAQAQAHGHAQGQGPVPSHGPGLMPAPMGAQMGGQMPNFLPTPPNSAGGLQAT